MWLKSVFIFTAQIWSVDATKVLNQISLLSMRRLCERQNSCGFSSHWACSHHCHIIHQLSAAVNEVEYEGSQQRRLGDRRLKMLLSLKSWWTVITLLLPQQTCGLLCQWYSAVHAVCSMGHFQLRCKHSLWRTSLHVTGRKTFINITRYLLLRGDRQGLQACGHQRQTLLKCRYQISL